MSMYRSRKGQKRWRTRWPWNRLLPLRVDERFCPKCQMPFHEGPLPQEVARYFVDNTCCFVFPAGSFRRGEYVIRVGRWKAGGKQFYCSEFVPAEDLDNVLAVVQMAQEEIAKLSRKTKRRSV